LSSRKYKKAVYLSFIALTLCACAGSNQAKLFDSQFKTRISEAGLKHFELRYYQARPNNFNSPTRDTSPQPSLKKQKRLMHKHAESIIEDNQFCREGFWLLNFELDLKGPFLRGECNDLATEKDRSLFPDDIQNW